MKYKIRVDDLERSEIAEVIEDASSAAEAAFKAGMRLVVERGHDRFLLEEVYQEAGWVRVKLS